MILCSLTVVLSALSMACVVAPHGETLPKGPPWHVTYQAAKQDAIRNGRPVFVYFTKTY